MNKKELTHELSVRTKLSQKTCKVVLDETIDIIKECFYTGKSVMINDFGKFVYKEIKPRKRYVPSLKVVINEKQKIIPRFMPSKKFYGKIQ